MINYIFDRKRLKYHRRNGIKANEKNSQQNNKRKFGFYLVMFTKLIKSTSSFPLTDFLIESITIQWIFPWFHSSMSVRLRFCVIENDVRSTHIHAHKGFMFISKSFAIFFPYSSNELVRNCLILKLQESINLWNKYGLHFEICAYSVHTKLKYYFPKTGL